MKLNYKKTFLLGFGFFAISLTWSLYNSYVPIFLREFIGSNFLVGFIMTIDNYAGLFMQPIFGTLSDVTNTKYGRRMPYLLIGMPIAALILCIIPMHYSLVSLMASIISLNLVMASFRAPTIALMPDLTPSPLRSKANGIINLMGGVGAITAYFIGSFLYDMDKAYPFYMAAALMIISILVLFLNIKEKRDSLNYNNIPKKEDKEKETLQEKLKISKNVVFLLIAIFFWFVAFNAVETFFTLYGKEYLNIKESTAARTFTYFSISMVAFAIPAGLIATKIGKKKTIIAGLILMIATFGGLLVSTDIKVFAALFIIAGAAWALININSYPFVVSMTDDSNVGRYTGYYYLFSSLAAIVSPPLVGKLIDILGYDILFKYSVFGFILALIFILLVKPPKETLNQKEDAYESLGNIDI